MPKDGVDGGKVYVDIEPDAGKFTERLRTQVEPKAARVGQDIGKQIAKQIADGISRGLGDGFNGSPGRAPGRRTGDDFAGEFDRTVRSKIQAALRSLPPARIGVVATEAEQKLKDLRGELEALSGKRIGVDLAADEALSEVDRIRDELARLGESSADVQVRVDTARAIEQLTQMREQIDRIDGRDVNVDVDVNTEQARAGLAGIGSAAGAAQGGLGALIGVGVSLGPAIIPAAAVVVAGIGAIGPVAVASAGGIGVLALGLSGVIGAVKAMDAAQGKAGTSASTLASRQASLASTADQLRNAQDTLRNAVERARLAQDQLTQARRDAKIAEEDLTSQIANGILAQRRAAMDEAEAKANLEKATAKGSLATVEQRDAAQLAYDEARQQTADLAMRQGRLTAEQQAATKAGIEGSPQVVAAQRGIAQAHQQVEQASRAVAAAQRAGSVAAITAAGGTAGGVDQVAQAMASLSPVGQAFARFIFSLKPVFESIRRVAETALLPGIEAGIRAFLPYLPQITAAVGTLAGVMGELFAEAGRALTDPFWINFFKQMVAVAVPILRLMGPILLNMAKGFAGILLAFAPLAPVIGKVILELSEKFAAFGTSLASNPAFQEFIDYAIANAPMMVKLFTDLGIVLIKLLIGFAPLGQVLLELLVSVMGWLASLDPGTLVYLAGVVMTIIGVIIGASGSIVAAVAVVIAAITTMVGFVIYAWNNWDTFRNVVLGVWNAIKTAIAFVWNNIIKPVFDAIVNFITTMLIPHMMLLWNTIQPVWNGIQIAIGVAWTFIKAVFDGIWFVIQNFLIPIFIFLYENVIKPVWQSIQLAINIAWAVIQVVFGMIQIAIKVLAAIFLWLWDVAIGPVWRALGAGISWVWNNVLKPVFNFLGGIIKEYVVPAFKAGVDALGKAWETIRDLAKIPIKFIIETVLNNGILAGYNMLAKLFSVKPDDVSIPIKGFATGGLIRGPGSGTSDSILAQVMGGPKIRVSNGEYIIPERKVREYGVGFFDWLVGKPQGKRPGDGSQGLAFAGGGLLNFGGDLWDFVTDPVGKLKRPINAAIDRMPGGAWVRDIIGGAGRKLVNGLIGWVKNFGGGDSGVSRTQSFLRAQNNKPYVWAAAGPDGYDCSGLVSAAWNMMHGRNPYAHTFSTANEAGYFPKPGAGIFTAGWAGPGQRGGGSVGHTAGRLAGLGFESRGGDGVVIGNGATSVLSFANIGHFDSGGYLPPGLTLAYNGTGQPERIRTATQEAALSAAGTGGDHFHFHGTGAGISEVQAWSDRRDTMARLRRPR